MHITQGPQYNGKASKRLHVMAKHVILTVNIVITLVSKICWSTRKAVLQEWMMKH